MLISPRSYSSSFQSTLPIREETGQLIFLAVRVVHFNPLFPYGKRRLLFDALCRAFDFNPLFPYGKRRHPWCRLSSTIYISIHSSHTGRDFSCPAATGQKIFQSTLPIREETIFLPGGNRAEDISIHSSHTGRDTFTAADGSDEKPFQSTLPIREETSTGSVPSPLSVFQSTLPIREETSSVDGTPSMLLIFQSTLPIREETKHWSDEALLTRISIHSSHTGRDQPFPADAGQSPDFNPLFPYGKRPAFYRGCHSLADFNPLFPYGKRRPVRPVWHRPSNFNPLFPYGKRRKACPARLT